MAEEYGEPFIIELQQIRRTLRPFRSKLQAFQRSINLPSGAVPVSSPDLTKTPFMIKASLKQGEFKKPSKKQRKSNSPVSQNPKENIFAAQKVLMNKYTNLSTPIRSNVLYLATSLKDVLKKFNRPKKIYLLSELCCFVIGDNLENFDETEEQEEIYEEVFPHFRAPILLQHVIRICINHLSLPQSLYELIDICHRARADYQTFSLILSVLSFKKFPESKRLLWLYSISSEIRKGSEFIKFLEKSVSNIKILQNGFIEFCSELPVPENAFKLSNNCLTKVCFADDCMDVRREKVLAWSSLFLSKALILTQEYETSFDVLCNIKGRLIFYLTLDKIQDFEETFLAFALVAFYVEKEVIENIKEILLAKFQENSLLFVILCFQSVTLFEALVRKLEKNSFFELASNLLQLYNKSRGSDEFVEWEFSLNRKSRKGKGVDIETAEDNSYQDEFYDENFIFSGPLGSSSNKTRTFSHFKEESHNFFDFCSSPLFRQTNT